MTSEVNVEHLPQIRNNPVHAFDLWVENLEFYGRNQSLMQMTVCARWLLTDLWADSGMATLEVELPTGFVSRKDVLKSLAPRSRFPVFRNRNTRQFVVISFNKV